MKPNSGSRTPRRVRAWFPCRPCGRTPRKPAAPPWQPLGHPRQEAGAHMRDVDHAWRGVRARAGLGGVRIHDLRHSYASRALALGEGLPVIAKLLGHAHLETTARYAHLARDSVRESAERVALSIAADVMARRSEPGLKRQAAGSVPVSASPFPDPHEFRNVRKERERNTIALKEYGGRERHSKPICPGGWQATGSVKTGHASGRGFPFGDDPVLPQEFIGHRGDSRLPVFTEGAYGPLVADVPYPSADRARIRRASSPVEPDF